jgi:hypothetical protein
MERKYSSHKTKSGAIFETSETRLLPVEKEEITACSGIKRINFVPFPASNYENTKPTYFSSYSTTTSRTRGSENSMLNKLDEAAKNCNFKIKIVNRFSKKYRIE